MGNGMSSPIRVRRANYMDSRNCLPDGMILDMLFKMLSTHIPLNVRMSVLWRQTPSAGLILGL